MAVRKHKQWGADDQGGGPRDGDLPLLAEGAVAASVRVQAQDDDVQDRIGVVAEAVGRDLETGVRSSLTMRTGRVALRQYIYLVSIDNVTTAVESFYQCRINALSSSQHERCIRRIRDGGRRGIYDLPVGHRDTNNCDLRSVIEAYHI
jgi:hypothetical protein